MQGQPGAGGKSPGHDAPADAAHDGVPGFDRPEPVVAGADGQVFGRRAVPLQPGGIDPVALAAEVFGQPLHLERGGQVTVAENDAEVARFALDEQRHAHVHGLGLVFNKKRFVVGRVLRDRLPQQVFPDASAHPEGRQPGDSAHAALKFLERLDRVGHHIDGVIDPGAMKAVR